MISNLLQKRLHHTMAEGKISLFFHLAEKIMFWKNIFWPKINFRLKKSFFGEKLFLAEKIIFWSEKYFFGRKNIFLVGKIILGKKFMA